MTEVPGRARLAQVALGETPAHLLVTGAEVVNVYIGEVVRGLLQVKSRGYLSLRL